MAHQPTSCREAIPSAVPTARPHRGVRVAAVVGVALVVVAASLTWASGALHSSKAGANLTVSTLSNPQLLTNPSFEKIFSGWHATGTEAVAVYSGGAAEDARYLETNAGAAAAAGSSVYQDVSMTPVDGHDYRGSIMLRSPTNVAQTVTLALWALSNSSGGPAAEVQTTQVTLSSRSWQRYSVDLSIAQAGFNDLRFQLYSDTSGSPNVDLDAAILQDAGVANASFEQGLADWNITGTTNQAIYQGGAAEDSSYLEWNTSTPGAATVYQDVYMDPTKNNSYEAGIMMRSPSGAPVQAQLVLWALQAPGVSGPISSPAITPVTVSSASWQDYDVEIGVTAADYTALRLQVYLETPGVNLDLDAASLVNAGIDNSSFEDGFAGWSRGSTAMNVAVYSGGAAEDNNFLEMNTGTGSFAAVSARAKSIVTAGHAYNGYADLRSPTGVPITVQLQLWTYGKTPRKIAGTKVVVSSDSWTNYPVELIAGHSGYDGLALHIVETTRNVNLDVGAVSVIVPHGSTSSSTDPGSCIYTPTDFANALLNAIPEPDTADNVEAVVAWEMAEGGNWYNTAKFNPLDTTQPYVGSVPISGNPDGVQAYKDWADGLKATVITITNGYYGSILSALAQGDNPVAVADAVGGSPWGTPNFSDLLGEPYDPPAPSWETAC